MREVIRSFPSNTSAGTCNNYILFNDTVREITGRVFYRVREAGQLDYRFFFQNAADSTFDTGAECRANMPGDEMEIVGAWVGDGGTQPGKYDGATLIPLTFGGEKGYTARPGELWASDAVSLCIPEGHYLVFQWTVRGLNIPYTPDKLIPSYRLHHGQWQVSVDIPQPVLVGAARPVDMRLAFLGDSITQGLGTRTDLYEHWVARIADGLPRSIAVWNLGLGYGRAEDAGSRGVWLEKAQTADFVSICLGVNDIGYDRSAEDICRDLRTAVTALLDAGVRVGIMTVPPFDYGPVHETVWRECCRFILEELAPLCEFCIEPKLDWGLCPPHDHLCLWGGHPDADGCALLAERFLREARL